MSSEKNELRARLLAAAPAGAILRSASHAVCARLGDLPELTTATTVLAYAATPREVSVDEALDRLLAAGVTVCLPWVAGEELGIGAITDLHEDVAPGWGGIREPTPTRRRAVPVSALDAVIAPGVAFDAAGNRLGHGGGHFDRLLAAVRPDAVRIGVGTDAQLIAAVPTEAHDEPVDIVITPSVTLRARPGRL